MLFFSKVFDLDHNQVKNLLWLLFHSDLVEALTTPEGHSTDLQDYVLDLGYQAPGVTPGDMLFHDDPVPDGEILPELFRQLEVTVAQSIKDVANKLSGVFGMMPSKQGNMVFKSMMKMNKLRPTIGVHGASIQHHLVKDCLLIVDDSSSVSRATVLAMLEDLVALGYEVNAHLALVSDTVRHWEPGGYSVSDVSDAIQNSGTHYETLGPLLDREWGTVICVADYDSSNDARRYIGEKCVGHIDHVIDVSLVNQPTFLAECVGQLADKITPMLVGNSNYVLRA
jgi:hypothetical protein